MKKLCLILVLLCTPLYASYVPYTFYDTNLQANRCTWVDSSIGFDPNIPDTVDGQRIDCPIVLPFCGKAEGVCTDGWQNQPAFCKWEKFNYQAPFINNIFWGQPGMLASCNAMEPPHPQAPTPLEPAEPLPEAIDLTTSCPGFDQQALPASFTAGWINSALVHKTFLINADMQQMMTVSAKADRQSAALAFQDTTGSEAGYGHVFEGDLSVSVDGEHQVIFGAFGSMKLYFDDSLVAEIGSPGALQDSRFLRLSAGVVHVRLEYIPHTACAQVYLDVIRTANPAPTQVPPSDQEEDKPSVCLTVNAESTSNAWLAGSFLLLALCALGTARGRMAKHE